MVTSYMLDPVVWSTAGLNVKAPMMYFSSDITPLTGLSRIHGVPSLGETKALLTSLRVPMIVISDKLLLKCQSILDFILLIGEA